MPFVSVKMLEGRTQDQKRALVQAITDALVQICDAPAEGTTVLIEEHARENWAIGGTPISDRHAGQRT